MGYVTLRRGERTQVRNRSHDLVLPTALAEVTTQLAEIRDNADDTTATRLTGLHQRLEQLTDAAQEQQEHLLEPLTPDMRDKHTSRSQR